MFRRIGLMLAWAVALVGLVVAGAIGFAQTETGKRLISDQIGRALTGAGTTVRLDGLDGLIPFDLRLAQLRVADAEGAWLEIDDAQVSWSPAALLRGRLEIDQLSARRLALLRLPPGEETEESEESEPLPELPRSVPPVVLRRLDVEELELGQAVLGERAVFSLQGELNTPDDGRAVSLTLDLERADEDTARAAVDARLDLAQRRLALDVTASETGGLLAALTGRPDAGSFTLELKGNGPLDDWRGELRAQGERVARAEAQIALAVNDTVRVGVDGAFEPAPGLLPAPAPELLGDRVEVALSAVRTDAEHLVLEELRATAARVEVTGSGRIDLGAEQMAAHAEVAISDLAPLAEVIDTPLSGSLSLAADVEGAVLQPQGRVSVEARDIEAAELHVPRIGTRLDFTMLEALTEPGARVRVAAEGRAEGLAPPPEVPLPAQDVVWHAAVTAPVDGAGTVAVDQLRVSADQVELTADGTVDPTTLGGEARIALALEALRPLTESYGQPIDGAADLKATVSSGARAEVISIDLDGAFRDLDGLPPGAAELLGRAPTLRANAVIVPDDSVEVTELRVAGAAATLDGQVEMALPAQTLDGTLELELPRLAVLAPVLGTEADGELSARAQLGGSTAAPDVRLEARSPGLLVAGEHIDALALTASAAGRAEDLDGKLRLAVTARGLEAELATGLELRTPTLKISGLTLSAPQTKIDGDLAIDLERALIDGELTGRVQEIGAFAALLPVRVRGQLALEARATAEDGAQRVALTARGDELGTDFGRLRNFGLQASVADALGEPQITADLTLSDLRRDELELVQGKLTANGTLAGLNVTTSVTGETEFVPFALDGRANLALGDAVVMRLEALSGRVADERLDLARPATLTVAEGSFALDDLDLRLGGARLAGAFALGPEKVSAQAALDPLPLDLLGRFGGAPDLTGDLVARLSLQGPPDNPSGTLEARATGVATRSPMLADLPAAQLTLDGALQERHLRLDLLGEGLTDRPIRLNAELPLVVDLAAGVVDVPPEGRIAGNLDADVRLARVADILALDDQRLEGPLAVDLSVGGTVARPEANGTVRIDGALYENGTTGTVLRDLTLRVRATRQTITIEQLTATDGGEGRLAGDGTIAIDAAQGYRMNLRLQLERARLVARDDVTATTSGDLALAGAVASPRLTGAITVNRAEILIPDQIGPSVAVIPVEEIGGGAPAGPPSGGDGAGSELDLGLDVTVDLPGQVFVRGRGLDSEWTGNLQVKGTASEPSVTGNLQIKRGGFELLGQRFELRSGVIEFAGATPPNPMIDVQAVTQADDITAVVRVDGEATAPQFHLDSEPSMPEDEIVSRILFKRAAGSLGPGDAIRLAAAVNTLRGGGLGALGQARQALGLDTLGVSGEGLEDGQVRAGKYLNDNVYVEVGKGAAADSEEVRLEVEIMPNLSLDAGTGANAESGIGLKWRYDY
ncbi:MAG TPA: translocation/assembly module TamB domain-containing protein [Geminicoccaceae bacterium]|nr:translocation/assembly module TamB domain-containing protein [Geminicoccaceae bacterium]